MDATVHNGVVATADGLLPDLYRHLFEQTNVALSVLDLEGRQVLSNRAFDELMAVQRGSTAGRGVDDITRPTDRPWTAGFLSRLAAGEIGEYRTEKTYQRGDGAEILCELSAWPIHDDSGTVIAILGAIRPIEERPVVTDARMRKMIEHIDDTISLIDADGNLLDTSGRYRPTLGYPKEFWATRTIFDLLHPEDAERVLAMRAEVLAEPGRHVVGEYRVRNVDDVYEDIEVHAVNLLDDPEVGGIVITSRNITARNAMLNQVQTARDEALSQADLRTRLIATVSHELRNPLHAMSGLSELLATSELPEEMVGLAATLHRQILGLTRVIDDLLETSRLDIGVVDIRPDTLVIRSLVDDVVMLGRSLAAGRAVEVGASVATSVPSAITIDPARLRQVMSNLVGNAVKFTDTGHVQMRVHADGDDLVIEVVDTGRGIPPDELKSVFEPFSTASTGGTRVGAGLGLSIVRQIVDLMGGSTAVNSRVGHGSTFVVRLPLVAADVDQGASATAVVETEQVLVVEDNPVNQMLAKNQLERLGMTAVVVGSGEEAIQLLERGEGPFIILMDHQLPGMDGLECTRQIRQMELDGRRRAVIIGVTASAMAADRDACLIGGMDDFLAKPVSLQDLGATLHRWTASTSTPTVRHDGGTRTPGQETDMTHDDAAQPEPPTIDTATLDRLADELGGRDVVQMLAATYLDELPGRTAALTEAAELGDLGGISRAAHTLKSSSRLLGGLGLGDLCQDAEHTADLATARALVPQVVALADRFGAELKAWMA